MPRPKSDAPTPADGTTPEAPVDLDAARAGINERQAAAAEAVEVGDRVRIAVGVDVPAGWVSPGNTVWLDARREFDVIGNPAGRRVPVPVAELPDRMVLSVARSLVESGDAEVVGKREPDATPHPA